MIKMQIVMDDEKIRRDAPYEVARVHEVLDSYLVGELGLRKASNGFYHGNGRGTDFSDFGFAFNTLRKKDWFLDNVKTWLYFNGDASDNPDDFAVEDFKDYCQNHMRVIV
ncbi:MAG: hypothetical protein LBK67_09090 [Coriobacteriales bacterium]|nr:hypothetical protein [Coriobacteriales bacterium]